MKPCNTSRTRRRGAVAPLVVISLTVLLSTAALSFDLGYVYVAHSEMQRAVDASTMAGASQLKVGTVADVQAEATLYAQNNFVAGQSLASQTMAVRGSVGLL